MENPKIFQNVLLDNTKNLSFDQKRLYSCIRLVADKCIPVAFYFNTAWSTDQILKSIGLSKQNLTVEEKSFFNSRGFDTGNYDPAMPKMVYMSEKDWDSHTAYQKNLPVKMLKNEFVLSSSSEVNRVALETQGLNATTAILCLAAVGLDLVLPNVSFELIAEEEIEKIKQSLEFERIEYLNALTAISNESFDRLNSGDVSDIIRWANNEVMFKIIPKARVIENNVPKLPKKTLKQAGFAFWRDGVPVIGKAYLEGGNLKLAKATVAELLKIIVSKSFQKEEGKMLPEIAYASRIAKIINTV